MVDIVEINNEEPIEVLPSEYKYEINHDESSCNNCSADGYTLIKDNFFLFNNFINTDSIYVLFLFNVLKNIYNLVFD